MDVNKKRLIVGIPLTPGGVGPLGDRLDAAQRHGPLTVSFVNPAACVLADRESAYLDALHAMDIVTCDGSGMVAAARAGGLAMQRESFDDTSLAPAVFAWAENEGATVGLVGGKPGVADTARSLLSRRFPGIEWTRTFSGYANDVSQALEWHRQNQTALVIVGMGAPRQEAFLRDLAAAGWQGIGFTCGGYFDQLGQGGSYYPGWVDRLHLRFAWRLAREPRRLWRRYLLHYPVFIGRYLKLRLRGPSAHGTGGQGA